MMSKKLILKINTENAAFEGDNRNFELARILRMVAGQVETNLPKFVVRDINGNSVGTLTL